MPVCTALIFNKRSTHLLNAQLVRCAHRQCTRRARRLPIINLIDLTFRPIRLQRRLRPRTSTGLEPAGESRINRSQLNNLKTVLIEIQSDPAAAYMSAYRAHRPGLGAHNVGEHNFGSRPMLMYANILIACSSAGFIGAGQVSC